VTAAGVAALAILVLPRVAWLAVAAAVIGWLATEEAGTALVIGVAAAATPLLLPRGGPLWSLPVVAPALGAIGLAPAYPAVAGFAPGMWRRAGLGAVGFLWLAAAEIVTDRALLYGPANGTQPRSSWDGSLAHAAEHAIFPAISGPALAPMAVFAAFAVLLPLAVRGRSLRFDAILAVAWAAGLVAALRSLDGLLEPHVRLASARGSVPGALLGAELAVAVAHTRLARPPVTVPTLP
jgi:hypothetical protein